jgi:hypothetical protein
MPIFVFFSENLRVDDNWQGRERELVAVLLRRRWIV